MKTLALKENQALYEVMKNEALPLREPIILEQNGRPVAALVPMEEYEEFQAWRQRARSMPIAPDWPEDRTLEEVVAEIKRLGPGHVVREPTASLAELLAHAPEDPGFNLEEWEREWAKINAEIEALDERQA